MKKFIITIMLIYSFATSFAQETQKKDTDKTEEGKPQKDKSDFWKKVRFGGGLGLNFPSGGVNLAITPTAIYQFNDEFSLGAGLGYRYTKNGDLKNSVYSISTLALYNPIQQLQISSELEYLFVSQKIRTLSDSYNYPSLHLGIAYRIGRFSSIGISYDILYDKTKSIYSSPITPIIRVFF